MSHERGPRLRFRLDQDHLPGAHEANRQQYPPFCAFRRRPVWPSGACPIGRSVRCICCLGLADGRPGHSVNLGWMAVLRSGRDAVSGLRSEPSLSLTTWPATAWVTARSATGSSSHRARSAHTCTGPIRSSGSSGATSYATWSPALARQPQHTKAPEARPFISLLLVPLDPTSAHVRDPGT